MKDHDYAAEYASYTNAEWAEGLYLLPPHMLGGMVRYIVHGYRPGSFLTAVLEGDLFTALRAADDMNQDRLPAYGRFLYNYAPGRCYGSPDEVRDWIKAGGLHGMQKEKQND